MNSALHHIRLLAGFEVQAGQPGQRLLDRPSCERLANALAEDLARVEPGVSSAMLVVGGCLLEPNEMLQPGWPAWQALGDLARSVIREHGSSGQILAIGSHQGRPADARLSPPPQAPAGQFLAVPMLLISDEPLDKLRRTMEEKLFETGGVHPPARALLSDAIGLDTVHGQLLTLTDLVALQHVQMDTAGLGGFWPVIEHILLDADQSTAFELPAGLTADWNAEDPGITIRFVSLDQIDGNGDDYALWLRAFRSLCALLDAHGISWQPDSGLDLEQDGNILSESAGSSDRQDSLTEHSHPDCGLVAWTLIENGQQRNLYPLSSAGLQQLARQFRERGLESRANTINNSTRNLEPAQTP